MPRPVNIPLKLQSLVVLPGPLYEMANRLLTVSNPLLADLVQLINDGQKAFNRLRDFVPGQNGVTVEDWNAAARARNWSTIPAGGVFAQVVTVRAAAHALVDAYEQDLVPELLARTTGRLLLPGENGIIADVRRVVLQTTELDLVRSELVAYRSALEPVSEQ